MKAEEVYYHIIQGVFRRSLTGYTDYPVLVKES